MEMVKDCKAVQNEKKRLFVDMDGTLAEWRNIQISVNSFEETQEDFLKAKLEKLDEILYLPGYFRTLRPNTAVVNAVRKIKEGGEIEVFILSCVKKDRGRVSPVKEKREWLDDYLPEVDEDHRIFIPDGKDKTEYIPGGITENDYILDDYTKNLFDWERKTKKGNAIKLLNNVNESNGSWKGNSVSYANKSDTIAGAIEKIVSSSWNITHPSPRKNKGTVNGADFITMYKSASVLNEVAVYMEGGRDPDPFLSRVISWGWNHTTFSGRDTGTGETKTLHVYYRNKKDILCELIDMEAGRTQGVIPEGFVPQIKEFVKNVQAKVEPIRGNRLGQMEAEAGDEEIFSR